MKFSSIPLALALALSSTPALASTYEPSPNASIYVDATVYHTATPDIVNAGISCDFSQTTEGYDKREIRMKMNDILQKFSNAVGTNGTVKKSGSMINPFYGMNGPAEGKFTGNFSISITNLKGDASKAVAALLEDENCTANWDARLLYTSKYARQNKDELMEQIDDKVSFYEEILGTKLTKISNLSFSTYPDYSSVAMPYGGGNSNGYDPETNSISATTTMNVTFDLTKPEKTK